MQSALLQIAERFGVAMQLLLIEGGRLLEHRRRIGGSSLVLLEVSEALAERQPARQLDKAQQIAALTATVAIEYSFSATRLF